MAVSPRLIWLLLAGLLPVLVWPTRITVLVWVGLCLLLTVLDLVLAPAPQQVRLSRAPLGPIRWGESVETELRVYAERRLRGVLRDAWQPSAGAAEPAGDRHRLAVAARGLARFRTRLTPTRRGLLRSDRVTLRLFGPLGLAGRQRSIEVPGELQVLPAFESRRQLPSRLARLRELDGRSAVRTRGQGTEFDSLRDYVRGDDVRSLDWRASARRRELVVRTWQPERDRRITVLLDTSRLSAGRVAPSADAARRADPDTDIPRLDAGMDAVLLLSALSARAGDKVTFLAGDRRLRARVSGLARHDLLPALSRSMSPLQAALSEADWTSLGGEIARAGRRASLIVLVTPLEPQPVRESLLPVLAGMAHRSRIVIASVRDPGLDALAGEVAYDSVDQVYTAAAAERSLAERMRMIEVLSGLGVTVLDAAPDELPARLADHYLLLKAQGRL